METLIIGGGVIGLAIARELRKRGDGPIRVLDKGRVGREASWAAAGILAPQIEADADDDFFQLCYESNAMYRSFADQLLDETGIDVELDQSGTIFVGFDENDKEEFDRRYAWQNAAGLTVEMLDRHDLKRLERAVSDMATCGLLFPDEGQVENRRLVEALSAFARSNDIELREGVECYRVLFDGDRVAGVETSAGTIPADTAVVTTGAWASHIQLGEASLPVKVRPMRGQMICYRPRELNIRHVVYSRRGYLVPRADGRLLAGATVEDVGFDVLVTDDAKETLKEIAVDIVPELKMADATEQWAGLRPYSESGAPFIGPVHGVDGLFAAVGHFRNGILLAPVTARIIADFVTGNESAFQTVSS